MEKDADYFTVGLFISLSLLALVGFVIWLMGVHTSGNYARYTIYFTDPVSGVVEDGAVKYKGVEVGKVLKLRLDPERNELVKVDVEIKDDTPVRSKTAATVEFQGITGQNFIQLSTLDSDEAPPMRIAGEPYPVLKGTGNRLSKFLDNLPELGDHLQSTLSAVDNLSGEGSKTADSIRSLADSLKDEGSKTGESIRSLTESIKEDPSKIINPPSHKGVEIPK